MKEQDAESGTLPEEILDLLECERSAVVDVGLQKARLFAQISATIDAVPSSVEPPISAPAMSSPAANAVSGKLVAAIAFVVGALSGAAVVKSMEPEPSVRIVEVPVMVERPVDEAPAAVERPIESPTPPVARRQPTRADPDRERALIERARIALQRRTASAAMSALLEHREQMPTGRLSEERDALMTLTLLALDRREEAVQHARAFRKKYPQSIFLPAIDRQIPPD